MLGLKSDCLPGRLRFVATRSACTKLLAFLLVLGALHLLFSPLDIEFGRPSLGYSLARTTHGACPAEVWASGRWVPQRPPTERTHFNASSDAYDFLGFEGCASNRELWWHLGADAERLFDRFPAVAAWRWEPPPECGIREMDGSVLVKHLVEEGGWLLIGGEYPFFQCAGGSPVQSGQGRGRADWGSPVPELCFPGSPDRPEHSPVYSPRSRVLILREAW